eukprot:Sspe_Gene.23113::Locus_8935_Transcript_2_2_Confidence_0.500_Length_1582::g.23113::m.23113/K08818/CDC2L; cell division cycle 2-like
MSVLREVTTLLSISHANVVKIKEAVVGATSDDIFLVMEYIEHDVRNLISSKQGGKGWRFTAPQVKCMMLQLLQATTYLHSRWILHRDLKTNNLLYGNNGVLKVCDFGMARLHGEPIRPYTPLQWVLTLPFRPPEGLLGGSTYDETVDMWSIGCIFAELLMCRPLFEPKQPNPELDMLDQIFCLLGTPSEEEWPDLPRLLSKDKTVARQGHERQMLNLPDGWHPKKYWEGTLRERFTTPTTEQVPLTRSGYDLLSRLLSINPKKRLKAHEALDHPYFKEDPPACTPLEMPTFKSAQDAKLEKKHSHRHHHHRHRHHARQ